MQRQRSHPKAIRCSEGDGQSVPPREIVLSHSVLLSYHPSHFPSLLCPQTSFQHTVLGSQVKEWDTGEPPHKVQQLLRHCRTPSKSLASEGHSGTCSRLPAGLWLCPSVPEVWCWVCTLCPLSLRHQAPGKKDGSTGFPRQKTAAVQTFTPSSVGHKPLHRADSPGVTEDPQQLASSPTFLPRCSAPMHPSL